MEPLRTRLGYGLGAVGTAAVALDLAADRTAADFCFDYGVGLYTALPVDGLHGISDPGACRRALAHAGGRTRSAVGDAADALRHLVHERLLLHLVRVAKTHRQSGPLGGILLSSGRKKSNCTEHSVPRSLFVVSLCG